MKYPELNPEKLFKHIGRYIKSLSSKGLYIILLLYYAYKDSETPAWAKRVILGSFAYFISPIDSIPDLTPFIGMTDDMGVLSFGLVTIACYIDDNAKLKAKEKLTSFLGEEEINEITLKEIDNWL